MATYKTAPNLGKPPAPETLTMRGRRASEAGVAAMRAAASGRSWEKGRRQRAEPDAYPGPHPLPPWRLDVAELTGSAKGLAKHAADLGLDVVAATNGREVEVRIARGEPGFLRTVARVVFREGRLVHAFVLDDGSMRKRTLTAVKAALTEAAS